MANLVAISFDDPFTADEAAIAIARLQHDYDVILQDMAVVVIDAKGKPRIKQTVDLTAGKGALGGSWWGFLMGLIVFAPLGGMLWGAGLGALWGTLVDLGLDDKRMKEIGKSLKPNTSALFLLVEKVTNKERALEEISRFKGKVIETSLPPEAHQRLADAVEKADPNGRTELPDRTVATAEM